VTFAGNAPTAGSLVLADNSALTRVFRSVSASGWVATWGGIQVVNFEQAETWVARGATSDDDVNGETAGTSCSNPDYIAGPTAADVQIQLGINLTLPGGIVHLCPGVYSSDATLNVIHDVTLKGAGANVSILDGTLINWTILDSSGALVVSNLGFQNGRRAINCLSGSVTVSGSAFNDNAADRGTYVGGIYANGCTAVNVTSSSFANNISSYGSAAIYMQNGGSLTISSSTFIDNHGSYGGAVYTDGDATVTSSKFTNNSSDNYGDGGAIHANLVTVTNSAFTNNSARFGGAIHANDATVASSTFTGNTTYFGHGGAIYASRGSLQRSRFTRNAAGQHGGAVYFYAATADDLQLLLRNTFTRNAAAAGGAITFASCGPRYSRSQVRRVERANRFVGNRATAQRRTKNIERWAGGCG
jgi:predicted outer membrane repeat protein